MPRRNDALGAHLPLQCPDLMLLHPPWLRGWAGCTLSIMDLVNIKQKIISKEICDATQGGLNSMPGGLCISARLRIIVKCHITTASVYIIILELPICELSTCRAIICQDTERSDEVFRFVTHRLIRQWYLLQSFSSRQTSTT